MEVTIENFYELQDTIIEDIKKADFISLDLELTGLNPKNNSILDSTEIRYNKYKQIAEKFKIIQVGITTFNKVSNKEFVSKPYNFYVFPDENSGNPFINCELSAILFNRDHKMDFNKWIYNGIPYMNSKTEKNFLDNLMDSNINNYDPSNIHKVKTVNLFKDQDRNKYEEFCKLFSDFLYSDAESYLFEKYPKFMQYHILNNMQDSIRKRLHFSQEKLSGKEYFIITKVTENQKKEKIQSDISERINQLKRAKGFRNIFEAIIKNKKIVVGHNCIVDINFIISHFGDGLPNNYLEWKKMLLGYFEKVYDTKYLYEHFSNYLDKSSEKDNSNLERIYNRLHDLFKDKIAIKFAENFPNLFNENAKFHDAAYDSFVTGAAFIYMTQSEIFKHEEIQLHGNKLFMLKTLYSGFMIDGHDEYMFKDSVIYGLKAHKNQNDIDISKVFPQNLSEKILKYMSVESSSSFVLVVKIDKENPREEFEKAMNNFNNIFNFYSIEKLREIIQEEVEKKFENKKSSQLNKNNSRINQDSRMN